MSYNLHPHVYTTGDRVGHGDDSSKEGYVTKVGFDGYHVRWDNGDTGVYTYHQLIFIPED